MKGMSAKTGKTIAGLDVIEQAIADIITTPPGTRVMRRDYGCGIWDYVDAPLTQALRVKIVSAVATAIAKFEPRVRVDRVVVDTVAQGRLGLTLYYTYQGAEHVQGVTL